MNHPQTTEITMKTKETERDEGIANRKPHTQRDCRTPGDNKVWGVFALWGPVGGSAGRVEEKKPIGAKRRFEGACA